MTTPVQARPTEGAGRRALWLAFASMALTLMLPLAGIMMSLVALVASIRAVRALRSAVRSTAPAVVGIVMSSLVLLISLGVTATQFYFSDELNAYAECGKGAGTVTAQNECTEHLERAMEKKMPFIRPGELQFPFAP
ncbi:hypothetical protein FHR32_004031 [Streptosporangium album]|uniref:DUF4190 domain-containing protein n=1 Tax=Streptosporangium album TaxID=47479 RepID=A0A7W7RWW0_9ACTN|nr:hypothetical protein [Streptosporangium album]MBB4939726.1 hypothetical protein [Streptosporangium album]